MGLERILDLANFGGAVQSAGDFLDRPIDSFAYAAKEIEGALIQFSNMCEAYQYSILCGIVAVGLIGGALYDLYHFIEHFPTGPQDGAAANKQNQNS